MLAEGVLRMLDSSASRRTPAPAPPPRTCSRTCPAGELTEAVLDVDYVDEDGNLIEGTARDDPPRSGLCYWAGHDWRRTTLTWFEADDPTAPTWRHRRTRPHDVRPLRHPRPGGHVVAIPVAPAGPGSSSSTPYASTSRGSGDRAVPVRGRVGPPPHQAPPLAHAGGARPRPRPRRPSVPVLELLDQELVKVHDDPDSPDRLMFFMPPQEGKSQRVSRWQAVWLLAHDPHPPHRHRVLRVRVRGAVGSADQARHRGVRRPVRGPPHGRLQGSRPVGDHRGRGIVCVGIRGALTGKPPRRPDHRRPGEGPRRRESRLQRDAAWEFWEQVAELRPRPAARSS